MYDVWEKLILSQTNKVSCGKYIDHKPELRPSLMKPQWNLQRKVIYSSPEIKLLCFVKIITNIFLI